MLHPGRLHGAAGLGGDGRLHRAARLLVTLPVLWAALTLPSSWCARRRGDPVEIMFGPQAEGGASVEAVSKEQKDARRRELGLDRPLPEQYAGWLGRVLRGDLGDLLQVPAPGGHRAAPAPAGHGRPAVAAFAVELVLVLGLGLWAAAQAGRFVDHGIRILALALIAVPSFWLGLMLLWLVAVQLQWVTVAGPATPRRLVLPALTLGLVAAPTIMRVLRASLLAELGKLHVTFARPRGSRAPRPVAPRPAPGPPARGDHAGPEPAAGRLWGVPSGASTAWRKWLNRMGVGTVAPEGDAGDAVAEGPGGHAQ